MTGSISQASLQFNWQRNVWKLKAPPKMKTFIWKALVEALSVENQLLRKGVIADPVCKRCGVEESIDHMLFQCNFFQKVWELAPISFRHFYQLPTLTFFLEEAKKFVNLPPTGLNVADLYVWICWNLWTSRNQLNFTNKIFSEEEMVAKAISDARCWQEAQACTSRARGTQPHISHIKTYQSGILCHVDAAWKSASLGCGMVWTFRGNTDDTISESMSTSTCVSSPLAVEALALLVALSQAQERSFQELHVFSDSQVLVNLLNRGEDHNELFGVMFDIHRIINSFHVTLDTLVDGV